MIRQGPTYTFAKTVDDCIYWFETSDIKAEPTRMAGGPYESFIMLPVSDSILAWGRDGSLIIYNRHHHILNDITGAICSILGVDTDQICRDVHAYSVGFVVRTDKTVASVQVGYTSSPDWVESLRKNTRVYTFEHEVDMVKFSNNYGLIRTVDGSLFMVCDAPSKRMGRLFGSVPEPIAFENIPAIKQIVCLMDFILLLQENGQVYTRKSNEDDTFQRVNFPEGTIITKIVHRIDQIAYLTSTAIIYYSDLVSWEKSYLKPLTISTPGYIIENLVIAPGYIAIIHDGGKLSTLRLWYKFQQRFAALPLRSRSKDFIPVTLPDKNARVMSLIYDSSRGYIITDIGCIYNIQTVTRYSSTITRYSSYERYKTCRDINPDKIYSMPFFESNPIAAKVGPRSIKSAQSDLAESS